MLGAALGPYDCDVKVRVLGTGRVVSVGSGGVVGRRLPGGLPRVVIVKVGS